MQFKLLIEELSNEEKKKFRELIQKFHPDKGGNKKIAQEIIQAKKDSDNKLINKLYKKHFQKESEISLSTYRKWANEIAKENDLVSVTKEIGDSIQIDFFKSGTKKNISLFEVQKYTTKEDFEKAAKERIKGLI